MKAYQVPSTGFVFTLPESLDDIAFGQYLQIVALQERTPLRILEQLVDNVDQLRACSSGVITQLYERVRFLDGVTSLLYKPMPKRIDGIKTKLLLMSVDESSIGHYSQVERWIARLIVEGAEDTVFTRFLPVMSAYLGPLLLNRPHADLWAIDPQAEAELDELRRRDLVRWSMERRKRDEAGIDLSQTEPFVERIVGLPCTVAVPVAYALYERYLSPQPTGRVISYNTNDSPIKVQQIKVRGWFLRQRYQFRKLLARCL